MLAKVFSAATVGLSAVPVEVEVDIPSQGFPAFNIVGLADRAVEEAKERVRAAIKNSGARFPDGRITVNLAPADLPKEGPAFDLPMAIGILIASEQIPAIDLSKSLIMGELALDGSLRHTAGVLPMVLAAGEGNCKNVFLPVQNAAEAAVGKINVYAVSNLLQLLRHLSGTENIVRQKPIAFKKLLGSTPSEFDFSEVSGQEHVKRALEVASAGSHNLIMRGVPGSGKTMLARAFPSILPSLTPDEALEVTKIYSITGNLAEGQSIVYTRPFRSPHHTVSRVGLIGGSSRLSPGEISLAHRGVLFLDEFPEFPRHVLEALRQPMEDGVVTISRAAGSVSYPAKFMLVAASNPCPCGYYGSSVRPCQCLPGQIARYQKRVSGPILDRIDIHLDVPEVKVDKLIGNDKKSESSKVIRARVEKARDRQIKRFSGLKIKANGEMSTRDVRQFCRLDIDCERLMRQAVSSMGLSARAYYKVIKIGRTIADLENTRHISSNHLAEALQYRPKQDNAI